MLRATRRLQTAHTTNNSKLHSLSYLTLLLIANSADIETNPGPRQIKYPCQICEKAVTWRQRGVACDDCEQWYHVDCMAMSTATYNNIHNISWICTNCGIPNFSSTLFNSFVADSHNSFSQLETSSTSISPGPPVASSSPKRSALKPNAIKGEIRCLVANFQSVKNKTPQIENLIETSDPTIILGNETWLNKIISSAEIFPSNLIINRNDREDGYGGVLIAVKSIMQQEI